MKYLMLFSKYKKYHSLGRWSFACQSSTKIVTIWDLSGKGLNASVSEIGELGLLFL